MISDVDALVAEARANYSARAWLHECSSLERDLLASLAASKHGTQALDFRKDPLLVRKVHEALKQVPDHGPDGNASSELGGLSPTRPQEPASVLLGTGTCPECQNELEDDGYCPKGCNHDAMYPNQPRAERPFAKRWG